MSPRRPPGDDPLLQGVVDAVAGEIEKASITKGSSLPNPALVRDQVQTLIDTFDQKRVLWVDDRPEGNQSEIAALSKLQIEVVIVRSTDEAMARIACDTEGFDLVISDWERAGELPEAGIELLQRLRPAKRLMPVVFYHGSFEPTQRAARAERAKNAGAFGEAVLPAELLGLVVSALSSRLRR